MLSLKVEGQGYIDIMPESIVAFEEVVSGSLEDSPNAKCSVYFDIGEGLNLAHVENSYDVIKNVVKNMTFEVNTAGETSRRVTIPRGSIVYRQSVEGSEESEAFTLIKFKLGGSISSLPVKETREELNLI